MEIAPFIQAGGVLTERGQKWAHDGVASSSFGSALSAGITLVTIASARSNSCRGARLMKSAKEWAFSR
jgi:hypothetical protein